VAAVPLEADTAERRRFLVAMAGPDGAALDRQMGFLSLRVFRKSQILYILATGGPFGDLLRRQPAWFSF
jgi:hypothetical protein